jgi:hypothetical protein
VVTDHLAKLVPHLGSRTGAPVSASVTAFVRRIGFVLPALVLSACFDVQKVDPGKGVFVISDFEQGAPIPNTELFDRWFCITYNPDLGQDPGQTVTCGVEAHPGDQSQFGLMAHFMLHNDAPKVQYPGVSLMTVAAGAAVDFNGYQDLCFSLRVDLGDPPPPMAQVDVQLGCSSVAAQDPAGSQEYFDLFHTVTATSTWLPFHLSLSTFMQRMDETNLFKGGAKACLALIDNIRFEVNGQFTQGQSGSGTLHVDDVRLENPIR